jgi:SAM-dependent methyltransferase
MRLSSFEKIIMQSPIRNLVMRRIEAPRLFSGLQNRKFCKVLELGCGSGVGTASIMKRLRPQSLIGTDFDSDALRIAQSNVKRWLDPEQYSCVEFEVADATHLRFCDHHFDAVVAFGVLHHIAAYRKAISEVARVLAPGGLFLLEEVTARAHPWPINKLMPPAVMLDRRDVVDALEDNGFSVTLRGEFLNAFLLLECGLPLEARSGEAALGCAQ